MVIEISPALTEIPGLSDHKVLSGLRVLLLQFRGLPGQRDLRELPDHKGLPDQRGLPGQRVPRELLLPSPDLLDLPALPALLLLFRGHKGLPGQRVPPALLQP